MAVKDDKGAAKRPLPKKPRPAKDKANPADKFNGWAFAGTAASWVLLLLGQRVLDAQEGASTMFTGLAVVGLVVCFGQRVWALMGAGEDRRAAAQLFAVLNGLGLVALGLFAATTDWGRAIVGMTKPKVGEPDTFGDVATAAWVILLLASLVPSILGELARRSMIRAERMESRRVVAAVVAGLALAAAAAYSTLFTYTAGKLDVHADFSYFRVAKPSESTQRMLDSLDEPLMVRLYFPSHSEVKSKVERYFEDLRKMTAKIEIEVLDRLLVPERAKEDKVRKDGVVVLQRGQMTQTLDIGTDENRALRKLKQLDGEFQKVLLKAMRDKRTVYLTVGHGELNETTDKKTGRTVSLLRQLIESQNYSLKNLGLSQGLGDAVPDDADVVVMLGPTEPVSEREVESLKRYAEGGGKLLLGLDPDAQIDLQPLAAIAGLSWRDKLVVNDKILYRMKRNDSDKKILVAKRFSSHASVSTLSKLAARGAAVLIPGAAPLDKLEGADKALKIDFAVKSVPGSYVDEDGSFSYDSDSEKKATYNLVAAVSRAVVPTEGADKKKKDPKASPEGPEMRAIVIGDADVFTDPVMDYAKTNRLLFLEALRWLGGEESFSGEISEEEDVRIVHTKNEDQVWFYTAILGVPSLVLGAGLFFTRGRRRRKSPPKPAPKKKAEKKAEPKAKRPKKKRAAKKAAPPKDDAEEAKAEDADDEAKAEDDAEEAKDDADEAKDDADEAKDDEADEGDEAKDDDAEGDEAKDDESDGDDDEEDAS